MDSKSLSNPSRTSSIAAIQEHQLRLTRSQAESKRKLSETSFDQAPVRYRKLRIEELNLRQEEQMVQKSLIDLEHEQRRMDDTEHRTSHREANKRIVSLVMEFDDGLDCYSMEVCCYIYTCQAY